MRGRLYVGNLPWSWTDDTLRENFGAFGDVVDATVVVDKHKFRSRGFGFVTFASEEDSKKALAEMQGKEFDGRVIKVGPAEPQSHTAEETGAGPAGGGKDSPASGSGSHRKPRPKRRGGHGPAHAHPHPHRGYHPDHRCDTRRMAPATAVEGVPPGYMPYSAAPAYYNTPDGRTVYMAPQYVWPQMHGGPPMAGYMYPPPGVMYPPSTGVASSPMAADSTAGYYPPQVVYYSHAPAAPAPPPSAPPS